MTPQQSMRPMRWRRTARQATWNAIHRPPVARSRRIHPLSFRFSSRSLQASVVVPPRAHRLRVWNGREPESRAPGEEGHRFEARKISVQSLAGNPPSQRWHPVNERSSWERLVLSLQR